MTMTDTTLDDLNDAADQILAALEAIVPEVNALSHRDFAGIDWMQRVDYPAYEALSSKLRGIGDMISDKLD